MTPEQIRQEEAKLSSAIWESGRYLDFQIKPVGAGDPVHLRLHPSGLGFLRHLVDSLWLERLTEVGLGERIGDSWSLALRFGESGWVTYEIRRMLRSDVSGKFFLESMLRRRWPEGKYIAPSEEQTALQREATILGVVIPPKILPSLTGKGRLVICYAWVGPITQNLRGLISQLLRKPEMLGVYLKQGKKKTYRGAGTPYAYLMRIPDELMGEPYIFSPPQAHVQLPRRKTKPKPLFENHWVVRLYHPKPPRTRKETDGKPV